MGDPAQPSNPADALHPKAPQDLRDFLSCTSDAVTLKDGPLSWLNPKLSLTIEADESNPNAATLRVGVGGIGLGLPAQVSDGQLSIDTSGIAGMTDMLSMVMPGADKVPGQIDDFVRNTNSWFKAHGKRLAAPAVGKGAISLSKVPLAVAQPGRAESAPAPVVVPPSPANAGTARPAEPMPANSNGPAVVHLGSHDIEIDPPALPPPSAPGDASPAPKPVPPAVSKPDLTPMGFEMPSPTASPEAPTAPATTATPSVAPVPDDYDHVSTEALVLALIEIRDARRGGEDALPMTAWESLATPPNEPLDRRELRIKQALDRRGVDAWDGPPPATHTPPPPSTAAVDSRSGNRLPLVIGVAAVAVAIIGGVLLLGRGPATTLTGASGSQPPVSSSAPSVAPGTVAPTEAVIASGPAWTPWPQFDLAGAQKALDALGVYSATIDITEKSLEVGGTTDLSRSYSIEATPAMRSILDRGVTFVDDGTKITRNGVPITDANAIAMIRKIYDPFAFLEDLDANWTSLAIAQLQPLKSQTGGHATYIYQTTQGNLSLQIVVDADSGVPYVFAGTGFQRGTSIISAFKVEFVPGAPPP